MIFLRTIIVSCSNKIGLTNNVDKNGKKLKNIPKNGLLGFIAEKNPNVIFLSTGATYTLLKKARLNVINIAEYTGFPEMKTGLVKSLHPRIHAGIMGHKHTREDVIFLRKYHIKHIDALIINFYPLEDEIKKKEATFEMIRQMIDVGGPTMSHSARKAFIGTTLILSPEDYPSLIAEIDHNNGAVSLSSRLRFVKKASSIITQYLLSVDKVIQKIKLGELEDCYEIIKSDLIKENNSIK